MRLLSPRRTLGLTAFLLFSHDAAAAIMPQSTASTDTGWTADQPLTGRAIPCEQGKIKTFACQNVELLSYLPGSTLGQAMGTDLWGWHDSTTGREFAILAGTAFVEVTDPLNPKYLGVLPPHEVKSGGPPNVKVYKHYAFIGYERSNNGLQVFDLTQLRQVQTPPVVFQETAHYGEFANAHTLALNQETGFAYANGTNTCGGGLHMVDVRTPTKPTFAGCYTELRVKSYRATGYVHDTQCVIYRGPDKQYTGREICFNSAEAAVTIADVTEKQRPKTISIATYPTIVYTHQGWLSEDQRYFFMFDEFDEDLVAKQKGWTEGRARMIVFDVADLDDPVMVTEFFSPPGTVDHNLFVRGRYVYQAHYMSSGGGLRIVDIADPKQPKEVGYLNTNQFAWTVYPYFKKDVVAISSTGLFLVRLLKR